MPGDDVRVRLRALSEGKPGLMLNSAVVRLMSTDPMTVRIDLDPE
jgi:hypothetical protein